MKLDWEKQAEEYNLVWEKRYQKPDIIESWVETEWARGRNQYLTFLIKVKDDAIFTRVKEIQSELSQFTCIDPFTREYFHISIKGVGFLVPQKTTEDEITRDDLPRIIREARTRLKEVSPFEVKLENLNNFVSAIVVQAHDGGVIRHIHETLGEIPGFRKASYYPGYLPHLSIAQYKSEEEYEEFIEYLEKNRDTRVGQLRIDTVELVIAHLPVKEPSPRLETIEVFKL
jgi:2'-5' RNA ligase